MDRVNLDFLINTPKETIIEDINLIFNYLIQEINSYINLKPIINRVQIQYNSYGIPDEKFEDNPFEIGVKKTHKEELLIITFFKYHDRYLRYLLLREAFKCYVPDILKDNLLINIFIIKLIEKVLKIPISDEWNKFIREWKIEDLTLQKAQIENFLKLEARQQDTPIKFFFEFIRRNALQIGDMKEKFLITLLKEYVFKTSISMKNDSIIETIRILIKIFYEVKIYRAFIDYKKYFNEFKETGIIKTSLSLRKFVKNVLWIRKFTQVAPNYQINWEVLDNYSVSCFLKFNPQLSSIKIKKIMDNFPFLMNSRFSFNNFGSQIYFTTIIPRDYLKDLKEILEKLENAGYLESKYCMRLISMKNCLNLNYFREFYGEGLIINPKHVQYDQKFELEMDIKYEDSPHKIYKNFSLFDWLLIDRHNLWVNILGVGFEQRADIIKTIKSDLFNHLINQRKVIEDIKFNLQVLRENPKLKNDLLKLIVNNKNFGFFYIKEFLSHLLYYLTLISEEFSKNPQCSINSFFSLINDSYKKFFTLEESFRYFDENIKKIISKIYIPLIFKSSSQFNDEISKFRNYLMFFNSCNDLKIFDINSIVKIIEKPSLIEKIYETKKEQLLKEYEKHPPRMISIKEINKRIESYLNTNPSIIKPILISTILTSTFAKYYPHIILKDTIECRQIIDEFRSLFPRVLIIPSQDIFTQKNIIFLWLYLPNLKNKEKKLLFSVLYNNFKENIIFIRRYFYGGLIDTYSRKEYYDLAKNEFFYTPHLFKQVFKYIKKIFGPILTDTHTKNTQQGNKKFWLKNHNLQDLIDTIEKRKSRENIDFDHKKLEKLYKFHQELSSIFLNSKEKIEKLEECFYHNNVKSINFKVVYQAFRLSEYTLYFFPFNLEEVDFKLFLTNSFQKFKFHANIANSNSFLINYIFPHQNPNKSYLNWLTKSKKNIREYCLFTKNKLYQILHFEYNLTSKGWDYYPNRFRTHAENILFNPKYKDRPLNLKVFSLSRDSFSETYGPNSEEYKELTLIQNLKIQDFSSYLDCKETNKIEALKPLLKKSLIFPFISLKNLELLEKVQIILPSVKRESIDSLIKIFSYFNVGFIYEIEGEYFIYSFEEEKRFENGLMIELNLPDCELHEFFKIFDLIFNYFEIEHYLILTDMVDGSEFLESIFGSLDFLKSYNPLKNLIWNKKDRIWMNHKLFNEQFEPQYPELLPDEVEEK